MAIKTRKLLKRLIIVSCVILFLVAFLVYSNKVIYVSEFNITNDNIPTSFDGYKIVQITDLHNEEFGNNQSYLIGKIEKQNPDIIVITGDNFTCTDKDINNPINLVKKLCEKYQVYYVNGNHEILKPSFMKQFLEEVKCDNFHDMDNNEMELFKDGESISLCGINDPMGFHDWEYTVGESKNFTSDYYKKLSDLHSECKSQFSILLSHRPERMEQYVANKFDLVFTGHNHGGQFVIPFTKQGLLSPDKTFFPKYSQGEYVEEGTTMLLSRGLGNSLALKQRLFDQPEILVAILHSK